MSVNGYVNVNAGTPRSQGVRVSGAGVAGHCEPSNSCWNRTQVVLSSTGPQLLSQLFSPRSYNVISVISIIR